MHLDRAHAVLSVPDGYVAKQMTGPSKDTSDSTRWQMTGPAGTSRIIVTDLASPYRFNTTMLARPAREDIIPELAHWISTSSRNHVAVIQTVIGPDYDQKKHQRYLVMMIEDQNQEKEYLDLQSYGKSGLISVDAVYTKDNEKTGRETANNILSSIHYDDGYEYDARNASDLPPKLGNEIQGANTLWVICKSHGRMTDDVARESAIMFTKIVGAFVPDPLEYETRTIAKAAATTDSVLKDKTISNCDQNIRKMMNAIASESINITPTYPIPLYPD